LYYFLLISTQLFVFVVTISQETSCEDCFQSNLNCVELGIVKLYSLAYFVWSC